MALIMILTSLTTGLYIHPVDLGLWPAWVSLFFFFLCVFFFLSGYAIGEFIQFSSME